MTPTERLFDVYEPRTANAIRLYRAGLPCEDTKAAARKVISNFDEVFARETQCAESTSQS